MSLLMPQGGVPNFNPMAVAGAVLWTRSDMGVGALAGGLMTTWADQTGSTNKFAPFGATGPAYTASDAAFNGRPSFNIQDTASGIVTLENVSYGVFTIFLCVQVPAQAATGDLYAHFNGTISDAIAAPITAGGISTIVTRVKNSSNVTMTKTDGARWVESTSCQIITSRFDGTKAGSSVRVNGALLAESGGLNNDPGTAPLVAPVYIGSVNGSAQLMTGKIAELAIYNRYLADAEVGQVERYMTALYGIA